MVESGSTLLVGGFILLFVALAIAIFSANGWERFAHAYLLNASFYLTVSLGGLFFVLGTHLFRASWCASLRRIPETLAANLGLVAVLFIPVLVMVWSGTGILYPWAQPYEKMTGYHGDGHALVDQVDPYAVTLRDEDIVMTAEDEAAEGHDGDRHDADAHGADAHHDDGHHGAAGDPQMMGAGREMVAYMVKAKAWWLNSWFFTLRVVLYFVLWIGMAWWYFGLGQRQDASGEADLSRVREVYAPPLVLLYAFTLLFGTVDLIMSLDPAFYSTMLPVIVFAGGFLSALCLTVLVAMYLQSRGYMQSAVNIEHYHDLGKLMFAFVFFWGYISFSQFMLLWYASIPETVYWLENRGLSIAERFVNEPTGWWWVSATLLFGHLLIPFVYLVTRKTKRNLAWLAAAAVWLLLMHWVDLYWMIMPEYSTPRLPGFTVELILLVSLGCFYVYGLLRVAAGRHVMAVHDPRMPECLALKQI
ncbi:hypothetical protein Pan265_25610 [Mucisphaera calidilacus]|uniref:Quinol:cytochrome C oxidoreductase n=1 Tax=Mucisphaera calidilacus TaxID=2527982 RepID=A0A518C0F1_9BACT|nr:hypothetical protein Pan265_25610 [Mucisphaera calidilacus]